MIAHPPVGSEIRLADGRRQGPGGLMICAQGPRFYAVKGQITYCATALLTTFGVAQLRVPYVTLHGDQCRRFTVDMHYFHLGGPPGQNCKVARGFEPRTCRSAGGRSTTELYDRV